jgi:hypothetical protein
MTRAEILDLVGKTAKEAQIRDDVCSRSTLIGLKAYFDWIPDDLIRASMSLCGGAGASSGSCGTYTAGLLTVGLKHNVPLEEELADPEKQGIGAAKFMELRDRYLKAMGTTLCPELQKQVFGRSYIFTNPAHCEDYWKVTDHNEKCGIIVEKAARIIAEMLLDDEGVLE